VSPRSKLGLIVALFMLPFLAAVVLRFGGWQPPQTRNHGELLQPPLPMQAVTATTVDGASWVFENIDRQWSLLVRLPERCDAACTEQLGVLPNVQLALGRHAPKLHMFRIDDGAAAPSGTTLPPLRLAGARPAPLHDARPTTMPELWLVDPHGFLVMRYPAGFDPSGLRRDLARLVR
jgi:hypothetical protein